ncbi:hypothetical protein [Verrucosispora sp. WMMC514]|uniref:hypothetical protein n=1 Tax=Verrucosispora sp. WMMC514 TaxID=3015156 RepID=UPI00248D29A3|nr:hypothetical protein [Verrucosispora sp. WMMC514]WBB94170.1 hypothetical protein O7597_15075 [Verrucosispora sp. WMMC514]
MTRAPATLLAVRSLLLAHLNVDKSRSRDADLEPAELGIVGDSAHIGGYHCGSDRLYRRDGKVADYSVIESARDRDGLTLDAAALDVGMFTVKVAGKTHTLATFSAWLVAQCEANAPDTRDIREIIWSPDGKVVKRWDRLKRRTTGDLSHRWHTHISWHRDAIRAKRDQTPLVRRYLTAIGLIKSPAPAVTAPKEDTMNTSQEKLLKEIHTMLSRLDGREAVGMAYLRLAEGKDHRPDAKPVSHPTLTSIGAQLGELRQLVAAIPARDGIDEQAIVAGVLASLTPEAIADAIPPTIAELVVAELSRRLAG